MYNKVTSLTEFIIQEEENFPQATGSFTLLMNDIAEASKIIASHVRQAGLIDILGQTSVTNTSGDTVKKLDVLSNEIMIETLSRSGEAQVLASEENESAIELDNNGAYSVFFDPLDGSSNIDVNINIGTIFSIYRKSPSILQKGRKQIAAGYVLYGPSVIFVYTSGNGVNGFTYDPSIGSFLLSHPQIEIPKEQGIYSFNESYEKDFSEQTKKYMKDVKYSDKKYTSRYVGSMVADVHRTLIRGGIFGIPSDASRPNGHLRLMYEVNPMAFIVEQAGGLVESEGQNPLDIEPQELHQKVPVVLGSKNEVEHYQSFAK